jgi:hypothetical protein
MRLIDADALPKLIIYQPSDEVKEIINVFTRVIAEAPTIDAEPIQHGKWIKVGDNTYRCSQCNEVSCCNGNFCTDCGARMEW